MDVISLRSGRGARVCCLDRKVEGYARELEVAVGTGEYSLGGYCN